MRKKKKTGNSNDIILVTYFALNLYIFIILLTISIINISSIIKINLIFRKLTLKFTQFLCLSSPSYAQEFVFKYIEAI
jgi:hypothetical protein